MGVAYQRRQRKVGEMSRKGHSGRSVRSHSTVQRNLKIGLALLALFLVGALCAGALAEGGALSALGALTSSDSSSTETSTDTTATDTSTDPAPTSDATPTDSTPADASTDTTATTDPTPTDTASTSTEATPAPAPVIGPYIVKFVRGTTAAAAEATLASHDATIESRIAALRMYSVDMPTDNVAALAAEGSVTRVEEDQPRDAAGVPNDADYPQQWGLRRIGWEDVYGNVAPGGSAAVAILDTGVAHDPDLDANIVDSTSILDGSDGRTDPLGHGTAMAGIVAAETNNGAGVAGVGYAGVKVMPVTVLDANGEGQDSDVIEGVVYAVDHGADVILMSFSNPGFSASLQDAIDYAWDSGAVLVAATGNGSSSDPTFPAGDRGVIGVASTDSVDLLSSTSNYGAAAFLAAPGEDIASVNGSVTGTSASAAIVAGAAALMKASSMGTTNGVIVSRLARTADPAGTTAQTGNGRVNLARAIADTSTESIQPVGAAPVGNGGPYVGPYLIAAISASLQAQSNPPCVGGGGCVGSGPWQTSKVTGWAELAQVPARVVLSKNNAGGNPETQVVRIDFDHTKTQGGVPIPGIQNLTGWTATGSVTITSPPVLTDTTGDVWAYSLTVSMPNSSTGTVEFFARISAGAHRFTGASLDLSGAPSLGTQQIQQPAATAGTPDLKVTKSGPATTTPGQVISYTLHYENKSTATSTANGVQLKDVLPSALTYVDGSCTGCTVVGDTITWDLGSLAPGATGTRTYQASVSSGAANNTTFTNAAEINSSQNDANFADNTSSVTTTVFVPSISGTVLDDLDGNGVDDDGGVGLAGAQVKLFADSTTTGPLAGILDGTDAQVGSTITTTASGLWTFSGTGVVKDKTYFVTRTNPGGYTSTQAIGGTGSNSSATKVTNDQIKVVLQNNNNTFSANNKFLAQAPQNQAPTAVNDSYSTAEDTTLTRTAATGVLANDTDPNLDALTAVLVSGPTHSAPSGFTLNADGSFSYTPAANYNGSDSFTYKANDGSLDSNVATVTLTITAVNDNPDAVNDSATVAEDSGANAIDVLANDTAAPDTGETLTVTAKTNASNGTVAITAGGTGVSYTPNANFFGSDSFTYTISDGYGGTDTATVNVTVTNVNDAPVCLGINKSTDEDTPVDFPPACTDADGDTLTFSIVGGASNGTASVILSDLRYVPNANYHGLDSFTYRAYDGTSSSNIATVNMTVNSVNDAPTCDNDSATTAEDTPVSAPLICHDVDGDVLSYTIVSSPGYGSLSGSGPAQTYSPALNYYGPDSFTFRASDGADNSNGATYTITVTSVNDPPDAVNDSATVAEDSGANAIDVLANDTFAPDVSETLTVTARTNGAHGAVAITGGGTGVSYTPAADYFGPDSFTYTISDGNGGTDTATVSVTVTNVNDNPDAVNDSATVAEDSGANAIDVLANDTAAPDTGETLTVTAKTNGAHGTVAITGGGTGVSYTPAADYFGPDSFTYTISDGNGGTDTATVSVTVTNVNDNPDAVNNSATVAEDSGANSIDVLANDTAAPDVGETLTVTAKTNGAHGTVAITGGGTGVSYTPAPNFFGSDSFTYTISDGNGGTDTATVSVTVTSVNDPPENLVPSAQSTNEDTALTFAGFPGNGIAVTDVDAGADAVQVQLSTAQGTLTVSSAPGGALITLGANNSSFVQLTGSLTAVNIALDGLKYTPNANFNGLDSLGISTSDLGHNGAGGALTDTDSVAITVNAVNDEPSFTKGADQTVLEDAGAKSVPNWATNISAGPSNESSQTVSFTVSNDNNGLFTAGGQPAVSSSGTLTYTPAPDHYGSATVSVYAQDNGGTANAGDDASPTQTFTINVNPVNDEPSFTKGADQTVNEDAGAQSVPNWATNISAGPSNESSQTVSFTVSNDNNGLFTAGGQPAVSSSGTLTYTPAPDQYGSATVSVYAQDNGGIANGGDDASLTQTFTIAVNSVNDQPTFDAIGNETVNEDAPQQTVNLTGIGSGAANEAQPLTVTASSSNTGLIPNPTVVYTSPNATGSLKYMPVANQFGTATITVTVTDDGGTANGGLDTRTRTFTITVNSVNDAPSFTKGANQTVLEDAGAQTVSGWATNISAGPANESGQTVSFVITANTNASLFSAGPSVDGTSGDLTYTLAANANGVATITLKAHDNGGTANGGVDDSPTQTFTITVTPVNDAPSFTKGPNQTVNEDAGPQTVSPWATGISAGPANESGQTVTFVIDSNSNPSLFSTLPAVSSAGTLTYTPAANAFGSATIVLHARDNGGTANGGLDDSPTRTFTITVNSVNDAPSFTKGADQTVLEDAGAQTVSGWATNISAGPANESGQTVSFVITANTNASLFSAGPSVDGTSGDLTYTLAANANGVATITLKAHDNGGTANGGVDDSPTQTFTITVTPVNDAPSFTKGPNQTVAEDSGANTVTGWATAISAGPANESGQSFDFIVNNDNDALFSAQPALAPNGTLTFRPASNANGSATVTVRIHDDGGTANGGVDTSAPQTFTITVTAVNDAPVVTNDNQTPSQQVQYSDPIVNVKVTASDIDNLGTSLTLQPQSYTVNGGATQPGLPAGLTITQGSTTAGAPSPSSPGIREWTVAGRAMVPAGTYAITVPVSDGSAQYPIGTTTFTILVNKENADLEYSGDTLKTTSSTSTSSTASVTLASVIREAPDGNLGDKLNTTQIKFTVFKFTDTTLSSPVATCTGNVAYTGTGQGAASCAVTLGADNYLVKVELLVNGYYEAPVETQAVTVVLAGTGFTTGGGWLDESNLGARSNFGFTVKYLKNGNIQGNSLYIYRKMVAANTVANPAGGYLPAGQYNWIIKSNAMGGLTQNCTTTTPKVCTATFTGKNNITAVNRATGIAYSLGGNYNFQVDVTDASEPGSSPGTDPDKYTIRVWDNATGTYYQFPGWPTQQAITGGNIQVRL
jgi:uncharacterized repeat protein (TIGR01451 family)